MPDSDTSGRPRCVTLVTAIGRPARYLASYRSDEPI